MSTNTKSRWKNKRNAKSEQVEQLLRTQFPVTDAYRYNSASIRVRVLDERFKGKSSAERDAMIEPIIGQLPENVQADIINLILIYPGETENSMEARLANEEFEDPSPSRL